MLSPCGSASRSHPPTLWVAIACRRCSHIDGQLVRLRIFLQQATEHTACRSVYAGWAKKVNPKCSTHNFVKYWPILKILSLCNGRIQKGLRAGHSPGTQPIRTADLKETSTWNCRSSWHQSVVDRKICNATFIKYTTTPQTHHYTTLWNVYVRK